MRGFLSRQGPQSDARAEVAAPGEPIASDAAIQSMAAGARLTGWQMALVRTGPDPLDAVARKERDLYVWIGLLMTGTMLSLALIAARGVTRSLRLAGMKTDLVATVSHELKTPVSSMRLLVDTLLDDPELDPRKTREYLELIARENVRLSQLIANFLAFSRMERNKYAFEFTSARAEDVVRAAVEAAGERFEQQDCKLLVEVAPHLPEIRADEGALVTALVNLLDNAYKYTPGEKHIALRAFSENGQRSFRGERQRRRDLAARRQEDFPQVLSGGPAPVAHRRRLRAGARHRAVPGGGPRRHCARIEPARQRKHVHCRPGDARMTGSRILIIEDDPALLRGLKDNFVTRGLRGRYRRAMGRAASTLALSGNHDLVLLDIMLPKVNGYEICREVRQNGIETPIIMLTAKGQEEDIILGLNLGADDYVTKPFRIRELLARANAFLRRRNTKPPRCSASGNSSWTRRRTSCSAAAVRWS